MNMYCHFIPIAIYVCIVISKYRSRMLNIFVFNRIYSYRAIQTQTRDISQTVSMQQYYLAISKQHCRYLLQEVFSANLMHSFATIRSNCRNGCRAIVSATYSRELDTYFSQLEDILFSNEIFANSNYCCRCPALFLSVGKSCANWRCLQEIYMHIYKYIYMFTRKYIYKYYTIPITYKSHIWSLFMYAAPIWFPIISPFLIEKLQTIQNSVLRIATGCVKMTSIDHLHGETEMLPVQDHHSLIQSCTQV